MTVDMRPLLELIYDNPHTEIVLRAFPETRLFGFYAIKVADTVESCEVFITERDLKRNPKEIQRAVDKIRITLKLR